MMLRGFILSASYGVLLAKASGATDMTNCQENPWHNQLRYRSTSLHFTLEQRRVEMQGDANLLRFGVLTFSPSRLSHCFRERLAFRPMQPALGLLRLRTRQQLAAKQSTAVYNLKAMEQMNGGGSRSKESTYHGILLVLFQILGFQKHHCSCPKNPRKKEH